MFRFIKKMYIGLLSISTFVNFSKSLHSNFKESIKYVTLNDHPCKARPTIVDINSNKTLFHPFTTSVNKCGELATLLMIHMLDFGFKIKQKILI